MNRALKYADTGDHRCKPSVPVFFGKGKLKEQGIRCFPQDALLASLSHEAEAERRLLSQMEYLMID